MFDVADLTEDNKSLLHVRITLPDAIFEAVADGNPYITMCLPSEYAVELACDLQQLHSIMGLETTTGEYMEELHNSYKEG